MAQKTPKKKLSKLFLAALVLQTAFLTITTIILFLWPFENEITLKALIISAFTLEMLSWFVYGAKKLCKNKKTNHKKGGD